MRSHTVSAEGGAAAVARDDDSFELHAYDTIKGSDFLADQDIVEEFVEEAPLELTRLEHWGCPWSREEDGRVSVRAFGGMSVKRTWFAADKTGFHMLHSLYQTSLKHDRIVHLDEGFVTRLLVDGGRARGVVSLDIRSGEVQVLLGRALILCALLVEMGVADQVLPELVAMLAVPQPPEYHPEGDVFVHTCLVLDAVREGDAVQAWTAVLHDIGKPLTFERARDRIRFNGHDTVSARMAGAVLRRLRAPREMRETVVEVSRDHIRFASLPQMGRSKRERWLRSPRFPAHLDFHRADCLGSHGNLSIHAAAEKMLRELPPEPPPPICTGKDVRARGVPEGPMVGEVLRALQAELDALGVVDRDTALEQLDKLLQGRFKPPF